MNAQIGRQPAEGATGALFPARRRVRLWRGCLLGFLVGVANGCYTYPPAPSPPATGSRVALQLNDVGRVGMAGRIGASADEIEGVVEAVSDSAVSLRVVSVEYLNGQVNRWSGEPVVVSRAFVNTVRERQYSRSRTFMSIAAGAGVVIAFIATRVLLGSGSTEREPPPGPEPPVN